MVTSVLGKLICRELGKERYSRYSHSLREKQSTDVFLDIYEELQKKNQQELGKMLYHLLETVHISVKISRHFLCSILFYIAVMGGLYFLIPFRLVMVIAMVTATSCLIYKIIEYVVNRYCITDIRMVLIYKSVLFHLLDSKE